MRSTRSKTHPVERAKYKVYLTKAQEFFNMMQFAQELEQWNAVGLNAVHWAISANDALLIYRLGIRSFHFVHRRLRLTVR